MRHETKKKKHKKNTHKLPNLTAKSKNNKEKTHQKQFFFIL